ncbi:MAG: hypothetical protein HQL08_15350, partial [Nitrospirae bacterium]|nr:hypothetical protein [Nitrospirota bacterium]
MSLFSCCLACALPLLLAGCGAGGGTSSIDSGVHIMNWYPGNIPEKDTGGHSVVDASVTSSSITHTLAAPSNTGVPRGGTLGPIVSSITNNTGSIRTINLSAFVLTPKGAQADSSLVPLNLAAGQSVSKNNISVWVPPLADTGSYQFCEYIYDTNMSAIDTKCLSFTVVPSTTTITTTSVTTTMSSTTSITTTIARTTSVTTTTSSTTSVTTTIARTTSVTTTIATTTSVTTTSSPTTTT